MQDVLTLDGRQFRNAACIVASPPCQEFSYMAMPWKRAKQIAAALRGDHDPSGLSIPFPDGYTGSRTIKELTALFDACFAIQREASEAAGHHIPMVVENVKGAQPWVGRANANYGSFYLWGDVRSVGGRIVAAHRVEFGASGVKAMRAQKIEGYSDPRRNGGKGAHLTAQAENDRRLYGAEAPCGCWDREAMHRTLGMLPGETCVNAGRKVPMNFHEHEKTGKPGRSFQSAAVESAGVKQPGHSGRAWFADPDVAGHFSSKSSARKAASAQIAKIPFALSEYIARAFKPEGSELAAAWPDVAILGEQPADQLGNADAALVGLALELQPLPFRDAKLYHPLDGLRLAHSLDSPT